MQVIRKRGRPVRQLERAEERQVQPPPARNGARDALPSSRGSAADRLRAICDAISASEHQKATLLGSSSDADSRKTSRLFPSGDYAGGPSRTYRRMDTAAMDVMTFKKTFVP
jgi:hypothetical protein